VAVAIGLNGPTSDTADVVISVGPIYTKAECDALFGQLPPLARPIRVLIDAPLTATEVESKTIRSAAHRGTWISMSLRTPLPLSSTGHSDRSGFRLR
jgi:hypothetical protein